MFHLPHPDPATGAIVDVGPDGMGIAAADAFCVPGNEASPDGINEPSNACSDVAIVRLQQALDPTELPAFPEVYTLADFLDRLGNHPGETNAFFARPVEIAGFDESIPAAPLRKLATVTRPLTFDIHMVLTIPNNLLCTGQILCSDHARGIWIHDPFDTAQVANRLALEHGDSGGPITFRQNGTTVTIFGVWSLGHNSALDPIPILNLTTG